MQPLIGDDSLKRCLRGAGNKNAPVLARFLFLAECFHAGKLRPLRTDAL
jgi:hypothetical protein